MTVRHAADTSPGDPADPRRQRGFALLIVLWTTSLLALIGAQVTSAGRTEARLASNLRGSAIAEAAADAAVQEAGLRLLSPETAERAVAAPYLLRLPQAAVEVSVVSESRKLPINTAPQPLIAALVQTLGSDERTAKAIANEVAGWRSPGSFPGQSASAVAAYRAAGHRWGPANRPFRAPEDLGLLLSMTPALLARLSPHVSVFIQSAPKPTLADPAVAAAMRSPDASGGQLLSFNEAPVYTITARARAAGGGEFIRRAVFRLNSVPEAGPSARLTDILAWSEGAGGPLPD